MSTHDDDAALASCPLPILEYPEVLLAHGGGGRLTQRLIDDVFATTFDSSELDQQHDGAVIDLATSRMAFSTDSFVVHPLFFPGGDIGSLAVHGTVNDLAMCGATPRVLSVGFIIEEGLAMMDLWKIVRSMKHACDEAGVRIVTGDTKVVDRGKGDGLFINTSGIGSMERGLDIGPHRAQVGDVLLCSGPIAVHGMAIMSVREGLQFDSPLISDSASLVSLVARLLDLAGKDVHVLRDPTRGGVSSSLNEIAQAADVGIKLDEGSLPVPAAVRGACEILGLDPLYVANEGVCLAMVHPNQADAALDAMRADPQGHEACVIGSVVDRHRGQVVLTSGIGGERVVDMLSGEHLPRIC